MSVEPTMLTIAEAKERYCLAHPPLNDYVSPTGPRCGKSPWHTGRHRYTLRIVLGANYEYRASMIA